MQNAPTPTVQFPPPDQLPRQDGLPDPFLMHDGSRVRTREDWQRQRHYLKAMLAYYLYGHMPPKPEKLDIAILPGRPVYDGEGTEIPFTLSFSRRGQRLTLRAGLIKPAGSGPFPVIIKNCRFTFSLPPDVARLEHAVAQREVERVVFREAIRRGYILCKYVRTDLSLDEPDSRTTGVFPLYPEYDWGTIAAWAWGYQLLIDALETMDYADATRVVTTGHSRGGKTALCGAIYDERVAIAAPNSSGGGGTGSLRYFEEGQRPQTIAYHKEHHYFWWTPRFLDFAGHADMLPFDAHTMKALVAPRGLINPHARQDYWANPYGTELTYRATQVVFDWLGVPEHNGIHWREGGHAQGEIDWRALFDFADRHFFGKRVQRRFDELTYPDAEVPMNWSAPPMP